MQADGFHAFSNTIQGKKSADDGKKRWKTMTHRLENFKDIDPLLENIGDARVKFFQSRSLMTGTYMLAQLIFLSNAVRHSSQRCTRKFSGVVFFVVYTGLEYFGKITSTSG